MIERGRLFYCCLLALPILCVAVAVQAAEPVVAALTYDQSEDRANFIAQVRQARQGNTDSQWQVGLTYVALGDPARALPILKSAADAGHSRAAALLGWLHEEGRGTETNISEAMRWYRFAAEHGEADAMTALGRLLLKGAGAETREAAWQLFQRAAQLDDPNGQYFVGWMIAQRAKEPREEIEAYGWFRKAAHQGHVGAQIAVGTHLMTGRGVAKDTKAAGEWLARAAETRDPVAHYLLGCLWAGDRDRGGALDRARSSFRIAAAAGHREAQFALASLLVRSRSEADKKEAAEWFAKADEAGHKAAANRLGEMLRDGTGVIQQLNKARTIFQRAADQGNVDAMYNLAQMQNDGLGGQQDVGKALKWYARAADEGHEGAAEVVQGLLSSSVKTSSLGLKGFWQ